MTLKCIRPFVEVNTAYACGQCLPCRVNRRRVWCHRIMLETLTHASSSFITLTYADTSLVKVQSLKGWAGAQSIMRATLVPDHLQSWLKRYRWAMRNYKLRFFAVGEYGDETERPHYHVAMFGAPTCDYGRSRYSKVYSRCCDTCELVKSTWGHGNVFVGTLEEGAAGYIAGYCVKKMTADDSRLDGRAPEFARMSRMPGIGAWAMDEVAHSLMHYKLDEKLIDVPDSLRHGAKLLPLGRYLKQQLRKRIGRDVAAPPEVLEKMAEELLPLHEIEERYSAVFDTLYRWSRLSRKALVSKNERYALSLEAREKLKKGKSYEAL